MPGTIFGFSYKVCLTSGFQLDGSSSRQRRRRHRRRHRTVELSCGFEGGFLHTVAGTFLCCTDGSAGGEIEMVCLPAAMDAPITTTLDAVVVVAVELDVVISVFALFVRDIKHCLHVAVGSPTWMDGWMYDVVGLNTYNH